MFIDELTLHAIAGQGGAGLAHFARRKYQPFGGPDGGDGGSGGDVVLVGSRSVDSLEGLRYAKTEANPGGPGGGNLKAGTNAPALELAVPLGTLALDAANGVELGAVKSSATRVIVAAGGKGGRGNPHFATAQNRVPKKAQPGELGVGRDVELRYRIYAETVLIEPAEPLDHLLLPQLLERDALAVDFDLYRRKPRWVRVEQDYRRFDVAYLALDSDSTGQSIVIHGPHAYWARHIVINLLPLADPAAVWDSLRPWLNSVELRQCERIVCLAAVQLFTPRQLETTNGVAQVDCFAVTTGAELRAAFGAEIVGGTVD